MGYKYDGVRFLPVTKCLTFFRMPTAIRRLTKRASDAEDCPEGVRTSQAVLHALSFFWLDGFAVPAPAQVTQTVGRQIKEQRQNRL